MSYANVRKKLPVQSAVVRFLAVSFLVFATFNPSFYSITTWIISDASLLTIKAFIGFTLVLTWLAVLRIAIHGLQWIGVAYLGMAIVVGALLELQFEVLQYFSTYAKILLVELAFALAVTFGLVISYWVRQFAGQSAVVKNPP